MSPALIKRLIGAAKEAIQANAEELTRLDQAIGDGDHGINMKRGFDAVFDAMEEIANLDPGDALTKAGTTLVMSVGGASGPLYGSLLMGMGKAAKAGRPFPDQLEEGVEMVKRRGKSDVGAKTMLDVLAPVLADVQAGRSLAQVRKTAREARDATHDMVATRGRASYLGERSRGHCDPGAASSQILIDTVCRVLEEEQ